MNTSLARKLCVKTRKFSSKCSFTAVYLTFFLRFICNKCSVSERREKIFTHSLRLVCSWWGYSRRGLRGSWVQTPSTERRLWWRRPARSNPSLRTRRAWADDESPLRTNKNYSCFLIGILQLIKNRQAVASTEEHY